MNKFSSILFGQLRLELFSSLVFALCSVLLVDVARAQEGVVVRSSEDVFDYEPFRDFGLRTLLADATAIAVSQGSVRSSQLSFGAWSFAAHDRVYFVCPYVSRAKHQERLIPWQTMLRVISELKTPLRARSEYETAITFFRERAEADLETWESREGAPGYRLVLDQVRSEVKRFRAAERSVRVNGWDFLSPRNGVGLYRRDPEWPIDSRWEAQAAAAVFNLCRNWSGDTGVCLVFGDSVVYVGPDADLEALAEYRQMERDRRRASRD